MPARSRPPATTRAVRPSSEDARRDPEQTDVQSEPPEIEAELLNDLYRSARHAAALTRDDYRERRRRAGEEPGFIASADRAESIHGWLSRAEGEVLYQLASRVSVGRVVVEIGSFLGRSTAYLGLGVRPGVPVYAIDPHTGDRTWVERFAIEKADTSPAFMRNMVRLGLEQVVVPVVATSAAAAAAWDEDRPVGLLFIDGWHSSDAVYQDGSLWLPTVAPDGVVVFDDWASPDVWDGLQRLKADGLLTDKQERFVGKGLVLAPRGMALPPTLRLLTAKHGPIRK